MKMRVEHRHVWVALLAIAAAAPAWALELPELMSLLARRTSGEATFIEERHVKGLDEPLRSSGNLSFTAPDRFARSTLKPRADSMVVNGNTVTVTRAGSSRSFMLDASPEALISVEAVRATLTGNAVALQRYFRTNVSGDSHRWTLNLTPLDARAAGPLRSVRIIGQDSDVRQVETELLDGDWTMMSIEPLRAGSPTASGP
jgi:outer membrane lipoprotein-sorting protein